MRDPGATVPSDTADPSTGASAGTPDETPSDGAPRRPRWRRILRWALIALVLAVLGCAGWIGVRGALAALELRSIPDLTDRYSDEVRAGDAGAAAATAERVAAHAASAAGLTGDPIWRAAESLPWVGANLEAVRVVADRLDGLSQRAMLPLTARIDDLLVALAPVDGRFVLGPLAAAADDLDDAADALAETRRALDGLDRDALIGPVAHGVDGLDELLDKSIPTVDAAADVARVLPPMLGVEGPRTVLLAVQNSAEVRTGGGITGTMALLSAADGAIAVIGQASSADFQTAAEPVAELPDDTVALWGRQTGLHVQDFTMPTDFALSGRLAAAWGERAFGVAPDTVVAVDPLAVAGLLRVIGPITLADGSELNADNLVGRLLVEPYQTLPDDAAQGAYFAAVTGSLVTALLSASPDVTALLSSASRSVDEGRISVWSAHDAEQARLDGTALDGPGARLDAAGPAGYGVWLNDATLGKVDTYLAVSMGAASARCRVDGRVETVVAVQLTNTMTPDFVAAATTSLLGPGGGTIGTSIAVAAPPGSFFGAVSVDGEQVRAVQEHEGGHPTSSAIVRLAPGESATLRAAFIGDGGGPVEPVLVHTPLIGDPGELPTELDCG